jgi:hypothetical protein
MSLSVIAKAGPNFEENHLRNPKQSGEILWFPLKYRLTKKGGFGLPVAF